MGMSLKIMNGKIISWLNRPFPMLDNPIPRVLVPVFFGLFVFLFLFLFQPFGVHEVVSGKLVHLVNFGVVTTIIMLANYFVLPVLFKSFFDPDKWTVLKNIVFIFWNIFVISIGNWAYNTIICHEIATQYSLFQFLFITFSVGIFPVGFLVLFLERQFNLKNMQLADKLSSQIQSNAEEPHGNTQIEIHSENNKETLKIFSEDLLCIISGGNYADIYYLLDDNVKKKLLRISLVKIEKQLHALDALSRCHRSYLINTQNIKKVSGNARTCFVYLNKLDFPVPVTRSYAKKILDSYKTG